MSRASWGRVRWGARGSTRSWTSRATSWATPFRRLRTRAVLASSSRPQRCRHSVGAKTPSSRPSPLSSRRSALARDTPRRQAISLEAWKRVSSGVTKRSAPPPGPRGAGPVRISGLRARQALATPRAHWDQVARRRQAATTSLSASAPISPTASAASAPATPISRVRARRSRVRSAGARGPSSSSTGSPWASSRSGAGATGPRRPLMSPSTRAARSAPGARDARRSARAGASGDSAPGTAAPGASPPSPPRAGRCRAPDPVRTCVHGSTFGPANPGNRAISPRSSVAEAGRAPPAPHRPSSVPPTSR